jgi:Xaa-Pro aminopeptidase
VRNIVPLKSYSDLQGLLPKPGETLGFELDVVPMATYQQVSKHLGAHKVVDGSAPIREARAVKTPYEIACIRRAAAILDKAFVDIPSQLREGMAEYELAARIEYVMRMNGHQGLTRVRRFNMELFYGAVAFGETASYPHHFDGPVGVRGLYPAVQAMGGSKRLQPGDPVMIDVVAGYAGYLADGSRTYSLGEVPLSMRDTHRFVLDLNLFIEAELKPEAIPGQIYSRVLEKVAKTSFAPHFMGAGENQVRFVAHGLGLEIDEIPVIAPRFDKPLEAGVVLAVEPKVFYPGLGGVGIENTYLITDQGCERLTCSPQEIYCTPAGNALT